MNPQKIYILMVDDHPMIIEGYQNTLLATRKPNQELKIDIANDCEMANVLLQKSAKDENNHYNVCFFDISLPPSKDGTITSGEDLAKIAKSILPNAKIIILTMFNESLRIHNIMTEIDPDGLLIKSDLTSSELAEAFQSIILGKTYYSNTVEEYLKTSDSVRLYVDETNRKILHLLSQGVKTKSLREYIDLSMSAIEKRKKHLKFLFDVEDGKDETLLKNAREKGYL